MLVRDTAAVHQDRHSVPSQPLDQLNHCRNLYFVTLDLEKVPSRALKEKRKSLSEQFIKKNKRNKPFTS